MHEHEVASVCIKKEDKSLKGNDSFPRKKTIVRELGSYT